MKFSIVTPSFRNSQWLKLCIASVADQAGVEHEHIVQDACSDDATAEWLPHDPRVHAIIEKDAGMYDAVNRGWRRATGDVVSYLNCDEQYLPGTLAAVGEFFAQHPEVDIALPDTVVVNADGSYLCHRFSLVPRWRELWTRFNVTTCSLFIRRRVLDEHGLFFDTRWRDLGDLFWLFAATERGLRFGEVRRFGGVFTETGDNMNLKPNALREKAEKERMKPGWVRVLEPWTIFVHRLRMLSRGQFSQRPFSYEIYTLASPGRRVSFTAAHPTGRWIGR